ncbi:hypothetical protein F5144DRAFT_562054 [Chaetomium tenue]|uniref:Uncharacterized protein n=1 Tax=Chaetomium tenue TaxID=1854479 RepID=A0ACB7PHC5_9PEZI|nr:hypothetical protein F5144DRAFT_562054 [Chaetomium globosum]
MSTARQQINLAWLVCSHVSAIPGPGRSRPKWAGSGQAGLATSLPAGLPTVCFGAPVSAYCVLQPGLGPAVDLSLTERGAAAVIGVRIGQTGQAGGWSAMRGLGRPHILFLGRERGLGIQARLSWLLAAVMGRARVM